MKGALIHRLAYLHGRAARVQPGLHVRIELRQGAQRRQRGDRHQLAQPQVQAARPAHVAEDVALEYAHELRVRALVPRGRDVEKLLHHALGPLFSVHF